MKALKGLGWLIWRLVGLPLTVIGVVTALTLVFSLLGIVSMFIAVVVPFALAPLALMWLARRTRSDK